MSRREWEREGRIPLHTLRADIDFGQAEAHTTFGRIGVKVWIYRGDIVRAEQPAPPGGAADGRQRGRELPRRAPGGRDEPMLMLNRRVKYRKLHRGRMPGHAPRAGTTVAFGEFGLQALEPAWITARQIEAARRAMTHSVKRGGKVWIRVFPDKPVTKKPAETRMGSRQGRAGPLGRRRAPRTHPVRDGRASSTRRPSRPCASRPTSSRSRPASWSARTRRRSPMEIGEVRKLSDRELDDRLTEAKQDLWQAPLRAVHTPIEGLQPDPGDATHDRSDPAPSSASGQPPRARSSRSAGMTTEEPAHP